MDIELELAGRETHICCHAERPHVHLHGVIHPLGRYGKDLVRKISDRASESDMKTKILQALNRSHQTRDAKVAYHRVPGTRDQDVILKNRRRGNMSSSMMQKSLRTGLIPEWTAFLLCRNSRPRAIPVTYVCTYVSDTQREMARDRLYATGRNPDAN